MMVVLKRWVDEDDNDGLGERETRHGTATALAEDHGLHAVIVDRVLDLLNVPHLIPHSHALMSMLWHHRRRTQDRRAGRRPRDAPSRGYRDAKESREPLGFLDFEFKVDLNLLRLGFGLGRGFALVLEEGPAGEGADAVVVAAIVWEKVGRRVISRVVKWNYVRRLVEASTRLSASRRKAVERPTLSGERHTVH